MKFLKFIILLMIGSSNMLTHSQDDNGRRWLIIVSKDNNIKFQQQIQWIENKKQAAIERKIGVIQLSNKETKPKFNSPEHIPDFAKQFENKISNDTDFEVILIGLDGTIKLRQNKPVSTDKLFELIDSMPMRQREIQRKNKR